MVHAPEGSEPQGFALTIRHGKILQRAVCKGNASQACWLSRALDRVWENANGDAMVLFFVREEAEHVVAVSDFGVEKLHVEVAHGLETLRVGRAQDHMSEICWPQDFGAGSHTGRRLSCYWYV
jgi:hypothetical protein